MSDDYIDMTTSVLKCVDTMIETSWAMLALIVKMDNEFGPMKGMMIDQTKEPRFIRCQWEAPGFGRITIQFSFAVQRKPFSIGLIVPDIYSGEHVRLLPEPLRTVSEFIQAISIASGNDGIPRVVKLDDDV